MLKPSFIPFDLSIGLFNFCDFSRHFAVGSDPRNLHLRLLLARVLNIRMFRDGGGRRIIIDTKHQLADSVSGGGEGGLFFEKHNSIILLSRSVQVDFFIFFLYTKSHSIAA